MLFDSFIWNRCVAISLKNCLLKNTDLSLAPFVLIFNWRILLPQILLVLIGFNRLFTHSTQFFCYRLKWLKRVKNSSNSFVYWLIFTSVTYDCRCLTESLTRIDSYHIASKNSDTKFGWWWHYTLVVVWLFISRCERVFRWFLAVVSYAYRFCFLSMAQYVVCYPKKNQQ